MMKNALISLLFAGVAVCGGFAYSRGSTDLSTLDDETRSLVMKEKMRAQSFKNESGQVDQSKNQKDMLKRKNTTVIEGGVTTGCDINIGNTSSKPGANTKQTTVVITGPVIQMPGKGCK